MKHLVIGHSQPTQQKHGYKRQCLSPISATFIVPASQHNNDNSPQKFYILPELYNTHALLFKSKSNVTHPCYQPMHDFIIKKEEEETTKSLK